MCALWLNDELNDPQQIIPRCHTLIYGNEDPEIFLCINKTFMYKHLIHRDYKFLGEWVMLTEGHYLYYVHISLDSKTISPSERIEAIPKLLSIIKHNEGPFFNAHPELLKASIYVFFESVDPSLEKIEQWGTFVNY